DEAQEQLKKAIKALDKAAQKKVIKKNTAARKKSRLNALVKKAAKA
ncbi:MAG: 30S ribosomal protein S20, partial [Candidatus Moranbacteria bacterium]|nr:30S ribosomal protein S20 [Candidatus Moranbacteria bacterium]